MEAVNRDQRDYWNAGAAERWVRNQEFLDALVGPFGERAMDTLGLGGGEHVLDLGCGCGSTTLELARRVGENGVVAGFDISRPMLEVARQRATELGLTKAHFRDGDVQVARLPKGHFDAAFSRFGVMFFEDPVAAFANVRTALKPGGPLAFVCWQRPDENPWMVLPAMAAAAHIELPPMPAPEAPGPFAFADPDRTRRILGDAGWSSVGVEPDERILSLDRSLDVERAVAHLIEAGPPAGAVATADAATRSAIRAHAVELLEPYTVDGRLEVPASAWVVTARA